MTIYNWLSLFGVPAILSAGFGYLLSQVRAQKKKNRALELGMQAILRDVLLARFRQYQKDGHLEYVERENWINLYTQYHALGKNGVMDVYKERLMAMPIMEAEL